MFGIDFIDKLASEVGIPLLSKGIKAITGIDITEKELTPEDKQKIMNSQIEIMKIDFEKLKEDNRAKEFVTIENNKNTASARENNAKIQESSNASNLAKNTPYILDFFIVISTFTLGLLLFLTPIPEQNKDILNILFGTLLGLSVTVVNYHRGSSNGSASKSEIINKLKDK